MSAATHQLRVVDMMQGRNGLRPRIKISSLFVGRETVQRLCEKGVSLPSNCAVARTKLPVFGHFLVRRPYNEKKQDKLPSFADSRKRRICERASPRVGLFCVTSIEPVA
jgi:hypothetical protein